MSGASKELVTLIAFARMGGVYLHPIVHLIGGGHPSMVVTDVGDIVEEVPGRLQFIPGERTDCVVMDSSARGSTVHQNQSAQRDGGIQILMNVKMLAAVLGEIKEVVGKDSSVTESLA